MSCAAAGSWVSWLSVSRAVTRWRCATSVSPDCWPAADCPAADGCCPAADGCCDVLPVAFAAEGSGCCGFWAAAAVGCAEDVGCDDVGVGCDPADGDAALDCEAADDGVIDGSACAAVGALVAELVDASVFGVDGAPAMPAASAVLCVRTSINLARVASSTVAADAFEPAAPLVPVAPGVVAVDDVEAVSLPTMSVMILSIAATSVPQFAWLEAFGDFLLLLAVAPLVLASADGPRCSRLLRWRFSCARDDRSFAGTELALMSFTACCA